MKTAEAGRRRLAWLCYAPSLLLVLLLAATGPAVWPFPQDDLLRNAVAVSWGFDYRALYLYAPGMPPFDPYLGFDWLLAGVRAETSPYGAVAAAQLASSGFFAWALWRNLNDLPDPGFRLQLVIVLLLSSLAVSKLIGGRPEVLATAWLLLAGTMRPWRWLALGLALSPLYWLFPVYAATGALLLRQSWRQRLVWAVAATLATAGFWLSYAGLEWVYALRELPTLPARRLIAVEEAQPVTWLLRHPGTWLLAGTLPLALWHWRQGREWRWLLVMGVWLGIGSARHVLVLAPLWLLWLARQTYIRPSGQAVWALVVATPLVALLAGNQWVGEERLPRFVLPPASRVLVAFNAGVFALPFYNPGQVTISPSIEPGWTRMDVQQLALALRAGQVPCGSPRLQEFTHALTTTRVTGASCLHLVAQQGQWRLWAVSPGPAQ